MDIMLTGEDQSRADQPSSLAEGQVRSSLLWDSSFFPPMTPECDRCDQGGLQDDKHAVFLCSCDP
eukprot:147208-Pelagomonas_calceolata.AAC.1